MSFLSKGPIKPTTGIDGISYEPPRMNPLWALAPLALGGVAGLIAGEPMIGLAGGAMGSVGSLMGINNYNNENQAYADMAAQKYLQEQRAKQQLEAARRSVSTYGGIPDDIAGSLGPASKEDYALAMQIAQNRAATESANNVVQTAGFPANLMPDQMTGGNGQYGAAPPASFTSQMTGQQLQFAKAMRQLPNPQQVRAMMNGGLPPQQAAGPSMVQQQMANGIPNEAAVMAGNLQKNKFADATFSARVQQAVAEARGKTANATIAQQKAAVNPQMLQGQLEGRQLNNARIAQGMQQADIINPMKVQQIQQEMQIKQEEAQQAEAMGKYRKAATYASGKIKDPDLLQSELARLKIMYLAPYLKPETLKALKEAMTANRIKAKTNLAPAVAPPTYGYGGG
jgi:hypothetical protein